MADKHQSDAKQIFVAGMFYAFVILTVIAFLFHLFGLDWFESNVTIPDIPEVWQQVVLACLKCFELVFIYRILAHTGWIACAMIAVVHVGLVGFIPEGLWQTIADAGFMLAVPFVLRHDKGYAVLDFLFLYILLSLYGVLLLVAKFGGISGQDGYSFYANVVATIDYKLFIVTIYAYIKFTGGFKLWKMKRKLLSR